MGNTTKSFPESEINKAEAGEQQGIGIEKKVNDTERVFDDWAKLSSALGLDLDQKAELERRLLDVLKKTERIHEWE